MKQFYLSAIILSLLAGCTTPKTMLRNEETGQVVTCGGSANGSLAGGIIGYNIQKSNDADCVSDYVKQGFTQIKTEKTESTANELQDKK